jgi:hypothetical protein
MSPRTTQLLHELRNLARLAHVVAVIHQRPRLGGEPATTAVALSGLGDRLASGFRARYSAPPRDLVELAESVAPKA